MVFNIETRTVAKTASGQALAESNGNTKEQKVIEAIANLQFLNPTTAPAQSPTLHHNRRRNENYPRRKRNSPSL